LRLFGKAEANIYKLHIEKYRLLGQFSDKKTPAKELFLQLDGPAVTFYNKRLLTATGNQIDNASVDINYR
jgi:hypothetical protein